MKLKEFVNNLNELMLDRPETADLDVVTAKDDEGNGYNLVYYTPQVGHFDEDREFKEEQPTNAVCVN